MISMTQSIAAICMALERVSLSRQLAAAVASQQLQQTQVQQTRKQQIIREITTLNATMMITIIRHRPPPNRKILTILNRILQTLK